MKDFYRCRNIASVDEFERSWAELYAKWTDRHGDFRAYLDRQYGDRFRYAYYLQSLMFTCGIAATQRVEDMFACLQNVINKHTTLLTLAKNIYVFVEARYAKSLMAGLEQGVVGDNDGAVADTFGHLLMCVNEHMSR